MKRTKMEDIGTGEVAYESAPEETTSYGRPAADQERRTPLWFVQKLEGFLGRKFKRDVAATAENTVCRSFYDIEQNGLAQRWVDGSFCNPPFKRFGEWIAKAYQEAYDRGVEVCVVGPVGCSQSWFHTYAKLGTVLSPDERISFFDSATNAPTRGADRDTNIYLFGPRWWNPAEDGSFRVLPLEVAGEVVRASKADRTEGL